MNDYHQIEDIMNKTRPTQSPEARSALLARVLTRVHESATPRVVVSPYRHYINRYIRHLSVVAVVLLVAGTSGTVVLADAAKPGDYLFSLDRATEELRLFLANEGKRTELEVNYLDERLRELETVVQETKAHQVAAGQGADLTTDNIERLNLVIDAFLTQANRVNMQVSVDRREAAVSLLDAIELDLPGKLERVRLDSDRIDIRADEVRIRERDGMMEVEYRYDEDDDRYEDGDRSFTTTVDDSHRSGNSDDGHNDDSSYQSSGQGGDNDSRRDDRDDDETSRDDKENDIGDNDNEKETDDDDNSLKDDDEDRREDDVRSDKRDDD